MDFTMRERVRRTAVNSPARPAKRGWVRGEKDTRTRLVSAGTGRARIRLIREAARILKRGGIIAFPTETVYALAVNALDPQAVKRLRKVKGRDEGKPFTIQVASSSAVKRMGCSISPGARRLMGRFWPGPLTLVLPFRAGGRRGFRVPAHPLALALIRKAKSPLAVPSANRSGNKPAVTARQVVREFDGAIDLIIDDGPSRYGLASTVVDLTGEAPVIVRPGVVSAAQVMRCFKGHEARVKKR